MTTARLFLYNNTRLLMLRQRRRVFLRRAFWVAGLSTTFLVFAKVGHSLFTLYS